MPDLPFEKAWTHPNNRRTLPPSSHAISPDYVELDITTNFSFLRGASHPEEFFDRGSELGYPALGVADLNSLAGIVRAHVAAKQTGLRLIIGSRITFYRELPTKLTEDEQLPPEILYDKYRHLLLPISLLLYPTDKASYGKLSKLLTLGKRRAPKGACFLNLEDCQNYLANMLGIVSIHDFKDPDLPKHLELLHSMFSKNSLSLALFEGYGPQKYLQTLKSLSQKLSIDLVATNRVLYHLPERRALQDVLTCIRKGCALESAGYELPANAERYLKPPREMARVFRHFPEAVKRTREIAERTSGFSLDHLRYEYPREICPEGKAPQEYLTELSWEGALEKYPTGIPEKVRSQILYELKLIEELDYAKYFLTVHDIVRFARSKEILCQGRGAAANSAVCFCLGITSVDPDRINLLFERFISKERNEPPDIDIDFEHERREEVIQYIYNKFGRERAALVAEVITYRTRSAVRDVGKVFALSSDTIEQIIRVLTRLDEGSILSEQIEKHGLRSNDFAVIQTLELSRLLAGFPRHLSQHVGGFVISEPALSEFVPIENAAMEDRTVMEWDKDDIEALGMLKIDVLALGMLTCIRKSLSMLNEAGKNLSLHSIPAEDSTVYDMICKADTIGVFQIESRAQMSMLPRLKPRCFYDLVIEVAIVRPGPIQGGMVHPYLRRRTGQEKVQYPNKEIERVLGPTLGVPIFQEQAMELVVVAAGFTRGEADQLRRAMASWKRSKNTLRKFEQKIVSGMLANGYTEEFALQCVNQIKGFGEYGFPQSHSASFALLVYVSAWIKKHYPEVFAAALINSQPLGFYQPAQIFQDAERHGVNILPIDINKSGWDCRLEKASRSDKTPPAIRMGMRLIRGLQECFAERIDTAVKKHGPFSSIISLWRKSNVPVRALRMLAQADAFGSMGIKRQQALWQIAKLNDAPLPLFESVEEQETKAPLPAIGAYREVLQDYSSHSYSIKAHPVAFVRAALRDRNVLTAADIQTRVGNKNWVSAIGIITIRQRPPTASGVVFMTLEDETGSLNLIIWPKVFKIYYEALYDCVYLLIRGYVQRQDGVLNVIVQEAESLPAPLESSGDQAIAKITRNFF